MRNSRNKLCPICKKNKMKNFYAKRCLECYQVSRKKWFCVDCGKKKESGTIRCRKCYSAYQTGSNNPSWKGGLPKCKICNGNLSRYKGLATNVCRKCYKGKSTRRWNQNLTQEFREQGRSVNPEYYKWRNKVFKRDNYTCQICKDDKGGNLTAHHLESFATVEELRTNLKNGITLCEGCHKNFHKVYGYFNNTRKQFLEFIL